MGFTQAVSMPCSVEQFNNFLKKPLEKMGYNINPSFNFSDSEDLVLVNNFAGDMGDLINLLMGARTNHSRYFIESFSSNAFLALAAMTDSPSPRYGELYLDKKERVCVGSNNTNLALFDYTRKLDREEILDFLKRVGMWGSSDSYIKFMRGAELSRQMIRTWMMDDEPKAPEKSVLSFSIQSTDAISAMIESLRVAIEALPKREPKFKVGDWVRLKGCPVSKFNWDKYRILSYKWSDASCDFIYLLERINGEASTYYTEGQLEKWVPRRGDYIVQNANEYEWVRIFDSIDKEYVRSIVESTPIDKYISSDSNGGIPMSYAMKPATPEQVAALDELLLDEDGLVFNGVELESAPTKPEPKFNDGTWVRIIGSTRKKDNSDKYIVRQTNHHKTFGFSYTLNDAYGKRVYSDYPEDKLEKWEPQFGDYVHQGVCKYPWTFIFDKTTECNHVTIAAGTLHDDYISARGGTLHGAPIIPATPEQIEHLDRLLLEEKNVVFDGKELVEVPKFKDGDIVYQPEDSTTPALIQIVGANSPRAIYTLKDQYLHTSWDKPLNHNARLANAAEEKLILDAIKSELSMIWDKENLIFHLLPREEPAETGELAIFWDANNRDMAVIGLLKKIDGSGVYRYVDNNGTHWQHAIRYKSPEQFKLFVKS